MSLFLLFTAIAGSVHAVPPPVAQVTADCSAPVYASDILVCEDPGLRKLDSLLALRIAQTGNTDGVSRGDDQDWFRRSRLCAFEPDQRDCLVSAYCLRLELVDGSGSITESECIPKEDEYTPASSFIRSGFVRNASDLPRGEVMLSGFLDHGNLFGDEETRALLGDWWGGQGPDDSTWRFNLKAKESDPTGHSFAIIVQNDSLREDLMRVFLRDIRKGRPTRIYLKGNIEYFDAPTNASTLLGLRMDVPSTWTIRLGQAGPD